MRHRSPPSAFWPSGSLFLHIVGRRVTALMVAGAGVLLLLPACQTLPGGSGATRASSLDKAEQAWRVLQREQPETLAARQAMKDYNEAVSAVVRSLRAQEGASGWGVAAPVSGAKAWRISFDPKTQTGDRAARTLSLTDFARCRVAAAVRLHGFDRECARGGMGVPVVLMQDDPVRATRPLHPAKGDFLPATAVLEFPATGTVAAGGVAEARLRFYDPLVVSEIKAGAASLPLAENLTAPLQFSLTDSIVDENGPEQLAPSASIEDESKLFFINRYDPAKVPVVFVHGAYSSPIIWKNAVNELLADPELRRRYQPVCFVYPSGLPIPTSAARLRELLKAARAELDPGHRDAAFNGVVLVGHSMGGLLARMQVIDSGNDFWHAFYTAPPQKIGAEIDAAALKLVRHSLLFEHVPNVKTVVFISTPHQGTEFADRGIVQAVGRLILALPKTAREPLKALKKLPAADINPALRSFNEWGNNGIESLSSKHPYFKALARRPILAPFHSVICIEGNAKDPRQGTDGYVPYWSAHLPGAASETIVRSPHECAERPGTVRAVLKILRGVR